MRRLEGKLAVVTGAGSGIGEAIARRFASEGAEVVVADIDAAAGKRVAASIVTDGGLALAIQTDIADRASVEAMMAEAVATRRAPDVLVNNAGVNVFNDPLRGADEEWRRCMAIDLEGAWHCCRAALPHMLAKGKGAIVNIASNHSFQVTKNSFPYPVAKHALIGLTRQLAIQYADQGVIVNAISPGWIDTPLATRSFAKAADPAAARAAAEAKQPLKRLGRPEEIAAVAAMLASDEARFIVGSNLIVDGGIGIRMYE
jgi:NAD(P)-dependent dehydrogenase (short-subunit alcohol dehydrogenase family)